ncbi:MAG TPA: IS66 family transposase [Sporichthyaceae bacterium]
MSELGGLSREKLIALVTAQAAEIAALRAVNTELAARLERLERLVSRNSANSSMPPSKDGELGRTAPDEPSGGRPAGGGGRKRGKQRGAAGANLDWRPHPDEQVDRFPGGRCECGAELGGASDLGVSDRFQQTEIPLVSATTTQYEQHTVRCGCGREHTAARPDGAGSGRVGYGPNLRAWCVYLMVAHALPVHRCAALLQALTGATPSVGFVHATLTQAAAAMEQTDQRIRTLITLAYAVCCDETPIRVGPRTPQPGQGRKKARKKADKYLLVACTEFYTWYMLGDRDLPTFKAFILADLTGVVVHDRYSLYDHPEVGNLTHQLCCQHILRDLEDAAQTYPDQVWPTQVQDALRGLIHQTNLARDAAASTTPAHPSDRLISLFRHGVRVGLSQVRRIPGPRSRTKQPVGRTLLEVLRDREDDVLRFAGDLRVPPTSNQAERDVRPAKTQQNTSGRLTSEARTRDRYRIRGVLSTAAKHGLDQLTVIRDALTGRPWIPPLPVPT